MPFRPIHLPLLALGGAVAWSIFGDRKLTPGTYVLNVPSQAFPGAARPGVYVRVPASVSALAPAVAVYFHGHNSNIERAGPMVVEAAGAQPHPTVLVLPQLGWNVASGAAGQLAERGGLARLLADVFARVPGLATWTPDKTRTAVLAHSGGYVAAAAVVRGGGVSVANVGLLDALYGETATFEAFARGAPAGSHFANVYGPSTADNSRDLAARLATALGSSAALDTTGLGEIQSVLRHRAATIKSRVDHGDVPRAYLGAMLRAFATGAV